MILFFEKTKYSIKNALRITKKQWNVCFWGLLHIPFHTLKYSTECLVSWSLTIYNKF